MPRFIKVTTETNKDWSDWQFPNEKYRIGCCDCGLVHDMEFKIVKITDRFQDGSFQYDDIDSQSNFAVAFRAKRNNRSTAQIRRKYE